MAGVSQRRDPEPRAGQQHTAGVVVVSRKAVESEIHSPPSTQGFLSWGVQQARDHTALAGQAGLD